jgi:hypothetical protein
MLWNDTGTQKLSSSKRNIILLELSYGQLTVHRVNKRQKVHRLLFLPLIDPKWPIFEPYAALIGSVMRD